MQRLGRVLIVSVMLSALVSAWPRYDAPYIILVEKTAGMEMEQLYWVHIHDMASMPQAATASLKVRIYERQGRPDADPNTFAGLELRYTSHGQPLTPWLSNRAQSFAATLTAKDTAIRAMPQGVHDLSVEVRGVADVDAFKPWASFLHLARDTDTLPYEPRVPLMQRDQEDVDLFGPGIFYVDPAQRSWRGYPADPVVTAWQTPPYETDLYIEPLTPTTSLFFSAQMWWAQAGQPHRDKPFLRALQPKHSEDHRSLRVQFRHERLPFKDGPRGVGWMSAYVSGQVTSTGDLIFAEVGGRLARLTARGEIQTIAGWRVKPGKDPVWFEKPVEIVRQNMENVGVWESGRGEFRTPLDVAIDPTNERIFYVVGFEDHGIWRVDSTKTPAVISVFAGSEQHAAGFADGTGTAARFNGPASIVFDPVRDVMYVADQDNDAIRRVTRQGVVTTLAGGPGIQSRISGDDYDQLNARTQTRFETPAGTKPDIYRPQAIRVDSTGRIILLELGYGAIRRIDPVTFATTKLGEVRQKHTDGDRGWAWIDVDRWGNSGPKDGIYWCMFVGESIDGEPDERRFNEVYAWLPPNGGGSQFIAERDWPDSPVGVGRRDFTILPHYPWLIAVDPRGAVLMAGAGAHGVVRARMRRPTDPLPASQVYARGRDLWIGVTNPSELRPQVMKFGYNGHGYLGYADVWGLREATDLQVLDALEVPASIRNNVGQRTDLLSFLRANMGTPVGNVPQPPAPATHLTIRN
jgi:hypothetical protein